MAILACSSSNPSGEFMRMRITKTVFARWERCMAALLTFGRTGAVPDSDPPPDWAFVAIGSEINAAPKGDVSVLGTSLRLPAAGKATPTFTARTGFRRSRKSLRSDRLCQGRKGVLHEEPPGHDPTWRENHWKLEQRARVRLTLEHPDRSRWRQLECREQLIPPADTFEDRRWTEQHAQSLRH